LFQIVGSFRTSTFHKVV